MLEPISSPCGDYQYHRMRERMPELPSVLPPEISERNKEIYNEILDGEVAQKVALKHGLTHQRIYAIVDWVRRKVREAELS